MFNLEICSWPPDDTFKAQWTDLFQKTSYNSPFNCLEWMEAGVSVYNDSSPIYPMRFTDENGKLCGLGLLRLVYETGRFDTYRSLRTVDFNSQRITPLLTYDLETMKEAINTLTFKFPQKVDSFDFYKLDSMDTNLDNLVKVLDKIQIPAKVVVFNEQPVINLDTSWDEYLARMSQGHRKRTRRYPRNMLKAFPDYRFIRLRGQDDFEEYGKELLRSQIFEVFHKSCQTEYVQVHGIDHIEKMKSFYEKIFNAYISKNMIDICLIFADEKIIAYDFNLIQDQILYMFSGAYDPDYFKWSPGSTLLSESIKDSYERGDLRIEMGGDYLDYKSLWTKETINSYSMRLYGNSFKAKVKKWIQMSTFYQQFVQRKNQQISEK